MSEENLERIFRHVYWRKNEFQLILCDFPSTAIQNEIDSLERLERKIVERLGFYPQP